MGMLAALLGAVLASEAKYLPRVLHADDEDPMTSKANAIAAYDNYAAAHQQNSVTLGPSSKVQEQSGSIASPVDYPPSYRA